MTYRTMDDVRRANAAIGSHWFEPSTLRFFNSRPGRTLYGGRYFVTSERYDDDHPRLYTIREVTPDGNIETVGEFQAYATNAEAVREIKRLLDA